MALRWMRDQFKHLKIILYAVVAVFVLLVFVDWGSGRAGDSQSATTAVQIGDTVVSEQEFLSQLRQNQNRYQQLYGEQWAQIRDSVDLVGQTVQMIVEREAILAEANKAGIVVSPQEVQDEILSYPAFQKESGGFVGEETYRRVLRANRTTVAEFERSLRQDLTVRKLTAMMQEGVYVSDSEVEEAYRRERETADLEVVQLRYERFLPEVSLAAGAAATYFDGHQEDYRRPEQRVIRYLVVETAKLRRILEADDASLEVYYQEHAAEFTEGEQAKASHILIRLAPNASELERADAQLLADQVATMAKSGADFAALVTVHSQDPASKENGGDLGWFGRGSMVKEFEDAVFGGQPGDIIGPVTSQFGLHIIKIEGRRPAQQQPFTEVREQVKFRFLEGRAAAEAETRAIALARRISATPPADDAGWQAVADEDEAVVLNESTPFAADGMIPGTGNDPELVKEVFAADANDVGGPRATPRGWIVWQLKEIRPEGIPPFSDVAAAVEQELKRREALARAKAKGAELAARWRAGATSQDLAAQFDGTAVPVQAHRRGASMGAIGVAPGLDQAVFAAAVGAVVGPVELGDRGVAVARVDKLVTVDRSQLARDRPQVRDRLARERATRLLASIVSERRRDMVVTVNNELVARFASRG